MAELVQQQIDADVPQAGEGNVGVILQIEGEVFRNGQFQPFGRQPGLLKGGGDLQAEFLAPELRRDELDRKAQVLPLPGGRLGACGTEDPAAEHARETGLPECPGRPPWSACQAGGAATAGWPPPRRWSRFRMLWRG